MYRKKFGLKTSFKEEQQQQHLKKEYGVTDNNILVVERKSRLVNIWRNSLQYLFLLIRWVAAITVAFLAVIGLTGLVFPETRTALFYIFVQTLNQIKDFTGW